MSIDRYQALLEAVGSALWVFNNLHNVKYDPDGFIKYAKAAAEDCARAYEQATGEKPSAMWRRTV